MAHRLILLLFFVSGGVGLGYQVLWSRFLLGFVGVSAWSYATVLASFMGGLALGSALLGPLADRVRSPLRLFALLEAGVGAYALLYPSLSDAVSGLYSSLVSFTAEGAGGGHALWAKALVAGLLLLVPTTLMGGTYPALVRHNTLSLGQVGRRASQLYAVNALGASVGALLMAFVLMPGLGMRRSLAALSLANGLVALGAFLLARHGALRSEEAPAAAPENVAEQAPALTRTAVRIALALVLLEGFVAFTLEIAWTRYFAVVLGSSTYSFALVLAAFISGIALGSAWLARWDAAVRRPLRFFGWTQVLAGLAVLLPLGLYPRGPSLVLNLSALFSNHPLAFYLYQTVLLLLCALVMLPPAVLIGMAVPLLVKGLARDLPRLGGDTGRVYAWNTWGNVAGALLAGILLLPALGMEHLLRGAALGCVVVGLVAVGVFSARKDVPWRPAAAATALVIVLLAVGSWRTEGFAIQSTRRLESRSTSARASARLAAARMLLFEDDPAGLLTVYSIGSAKGRGTLTLAVNGKPDASSHADLPTQILAGHIPLLLAPQARDVLVVGLASGVTAGAVLAHPVRRLDVVEILSAMPRATRLFKEWNRDPLADPRLRLIYDDARGYLSHTSERYDVIVSEPSNPWIAGTGALFSREHYARAAKALQADGLYLQWLQTYELADETFATAVRTFRGVFPNVYAFQARTGDLLLVGSRRALEPRWSVLEERFAVPAVRDDLGRITIDSVASLLAFQVFSPSTVDFVAAQTPLENTDDNLFLEYRAPRDLFARESVSLVGQLDERLHGGPALFLGELLRDRPGATSPRMLAKVFSDGRVRSEPLHTALELASYGLDAEADELFSLLLPSDWPTFSDRVATLARSSRSERAARLLETRAAAILLQSALVPGRAASWDATAGAWQVSSTPPEPWLRQFQIELLIAAGRRREAAREILAWVHELPGPEPRWLVLRACEVDRGSLCDEALEDAASRSREPFLPRLRALREGGVAAER